MLNFVKNVVQNWNHHQKYPNEEFLTIIELTNQKRLYLTSDSLLLAKSGPSYLPGLVVFVVIGFFFGLIGIIITVIVSAALASYFINKKKKELEGLSADEILALDRENFKIPYNRVRTFELEKAGRNKKLNISTENKRYNFIMPKKSYEENLEVFKGVFPSFKSI